MSHYWTYKPSTFIMNLPPPVVSQYIFIIVFQSIIPALDFKLILIEPQFSCGTPDYKQNNIKNPFVLIEDYILFQNYNLFPLSSPFSFKSIIVDLQTATLWLEFVVSFASSLVGLADFSYALEEKTWDWCLKYEWRETLTQAIRIWPLQSVCR